ncbi:MAG: hypothetical protein ACTS73_04155 [Arsenophonus sp. NEOnobi-MAG3]
MALLLPCFSGNSQHKCSSGIVEIPKTFFSESFKWKDYISPHRKARKMQERGR